MNTPEELKRIAEALGYEFALVGAKENLRTALAKYKQGEK